MEELQTLKTADAIRLKLRRFLSIRPCKDCGSHNRLLESWNTSCVACEGCQVGGGISPGKIKSGLNQHNLKAASTFRKNWGIPVVFGGMSTK